ncbi:MAG: PorT family protein, partial [Winogradskyella sp.]|nr:PorT family protein [Winogradskyella sp.]
MKTKPLFIFLLLISCSLAYAQRERVENLPTFDKRKIHYGFYLGINQNDFKLNLRNSAIPNANITVE